MLPMIEYEYALFLGQNLYAHSTKPMLAWGRTYMRMGKRQLDKSENFDFLQPVYSLNLVNETFEPNLPSYYHQYAVANIDHPDKIIEGLHLIFVELTKFKPQSFSEKKMQVLWLRFLTEMGGASKVPQEFLDNPEVKKAVDILGKRLRVCVGQQESEPWLLTMGSVSNFSSSTCQVTGLCIPLSEFLASSVLFCL